MKRFFSFRFLLLLIFGAGVLVAVSALSSEEDFENEHSYGEPDGEESEGEVSSLVD